MAPVRSLGLIAARPSRSLLASQMTLLPAASAGMLAQFSTTSVQRHATPRPSPAGFRVGRAQTWEEGESSLDKAAKYFLMSEMVRGMYVVLEQFFRAP